jgi:hypothetical protein
MPPPSRQSIRAGERRLSLGLSLLVYMERTVGFFVRTEGICFSTILHRNFVCVHCLSITVGYYSTTTVNYYIIILHDSCIYTNMPY